MLRIISENNNDVVYNYSQGRRNKSNLSLMLIGTRFCRTNCLRLPLQDTILVNSCIWIACQQTFYRSWQRYHFYHVNKATVLSTTLIVLHNVNVSR